ncbi:MAG: PAS domain S-box protein, partial [Sphingomonadales bacterium]
MLRALATSSSKGARYALAIVAVVLCFLLRFLLDPWLGERAPFLIDTLVLLACALYLGWGPAAVAALIAAALGSFTFARDGYSVADLLNLALFAAVCFGIIVLADRVQRANLRASRDQSRAESNRSRADAYAEELNLLIDGASDYAIFMTDPEGRVTIWNRGAERVLGWSEEEIVGRRSAAFYPPDEAGAGRAEQDLQRALAEGRFSEETWQLRKDGSEFLADATITPLFDDVGALRGFAKVLRDVTDRHASERAVERRERLLRSILETVPDAMIVIDEQGLIVSFSAAAQATFGYTAEEVVGTNVSRLMPSPDRDRHDGYLERYLQTGERRIIGIGRIVTGLRKDGRAFPMELSVGEAMTDGQRLFTGFVRDLTDKQRTESRVQELQSELIHVSRLTAMGTMAATLAHELNQPLTAIANYAEAMGGV